LWLRIGPYLIALVKKRNDTPAIRKRRYVEHHHELIEAIRARSSARAERALRADIKVGAEVLVSQFGLELERPARVSRT
jgi:DNA-binding GntR family transcriptional regulator